MVALLNFVDLKFVLVTALWTVLLWEVPRG